MRVWGLFITTLIIIIGIVASAQAGEMSTLAATCKHTTKNFRCVEFMTNHDGDTATFSIPNVHPLLGSQITVRFEGIDTAEMTSTEKCSLRKAEQAREEVEKLLLTAKRIDLVGAQRDKYFRILADVQVDGKSVSQILLDKGLARTYDGGTKDPSYNWCK